MCAFYPRFCEVLCKRGDFTGMIGYYEAHRDSMDTVYASPARDNRYPAHFHEGIELVYVIEGEFHALMDGNSVSLGPGEMLISGCYSVHTYDSVGSNAYIAIIPMNAVPVLKKRLTESRFRAYTCRDDARGTLFFLMRMLSEEKMGEVARKGVCQTILALLVEWVGLEETKREPEGGVLCRMLRFLDKHFSQSVGVEGLAREFGLSRSYISHLIRAGVGMSLPQYVNVLRCRWVATQLLCTDRAIVELALDAGYRNARTFYTAFHKIYGMTPREYTRMQRTSV